MKNLYLILLLSFFTGIHSLLAQQKNQGSGISKKVYISVPGKTKLPPYLEITNYAFSDANGNNKIDAGETVKISFDLVNSGKGSGTGLTLEIVEKNQIHGLVFTQPEKLPELKPGHLYQIEIPIKGNMDLSDGKVTFGVKINEPNDFGTETLGVEIETQAYRPPLVKMVDYQVSSQSGTFLEKRKQFDLEVQIQNLGQGVAEDVYVTVNKPEHISCLSANMTEIIGELRSGEQKIISYTFAATAAYTGNTIPFGFIIVEKYNKYSENGEVELVMNQRVSTEKLVVRGIPEKEVEIAIASLTSDVDKDIPVNPDKYPNKVALIFGNEDYSGRLDAEVNVDYARRDAGVFLEYAVKTLGVFEENIYFHTDATLGTMNREIERVCELIKRMGPETELIFYYAGHGQPDEQNHTPYLIPVDVNATNLTSAIPLKEVYKKFGATGAQKITVVLDACFSGGGRNQGLLAARAVRIKPREEELMGNMVVFSASTGEQSALPYHNEKHGLFTYFLLKKLQETSGAVTFGELDRYLKSQVGVHSLRVVGKTQDPVTTVSPQMSQLWKDLTF